MSKAGMILGLALDTISKLPFEKLIVKPRNRTEGLRKMQEILEQSETHPADTDSGPEEPAGVKHLSLQPIKEEESPHPEPLLHSKVHLATNPNVKSLVTTKETVDYQNRELGKSLLTMQRHLTQKFRINGKPCDCGQSRHLLEIEALAEEAAPMVDNPDIYNRIIEWVRKVGPKSTIEAVTSGQFDNDYQSFANEARDLRKELLGTLDVSALWPGAAQDSRFAGIEVPAVLEDKSQAEGVE